MLAVSLVLSACATAQPSPTTLANAVSTYVMQTGQANQTLVAQVAQTAAQPSQTETPQASATSIATAVMGSPAAQTATLPAQTAAVTQTPTANSASTGSPADWAALGNYVSIPDGSIFNVSDTFTTTWRIKNIGTTTWTTDYALVYVSGDVMTGDKTVALTANVAPGAQVDLSVMMTAPADPGKYQGFWELRNATGTLFGTGPQANQPFEVKIAAVKVDYNFANSYCDSGVTWVNGSSTQLSCPGASGSADGAIQRIDNPTLEDGSTANGSALQEEPQQITNGVLKGTFYPGITVLKGDHFKTVIGCVQNANCNLTFALHAIINGGSEVSLGSWDQTNDHLVVKIDVDLSAYAGQTVAFILKVSAKTASSQNKGLWLNPRIER